MWDIAYGTESEGRVLDKRYLERRRQTWYVVVRVPDSLYPVVRKRKIIKSLKTRDIEEARALRWGAVASIKEYLHQERCGEEQGFCSKQVSGPCEKPHGSTEPLTFPDLDHSANSLSTTLNDHFLIQLYGPDGSV